MKTPNSSGILLNFFFVGGGNKMDTSVKVKIEFADSSTIFLSRSQYDKYNDAGMYTFIGGGDYGHNYELTVLRTGTIQPLVSDLAPEVSLLFGSLNQMQQCIF